MNLGYLICALFHYLQIYETFIHFSVKFLELNLKIVDKNSDIFVPQMIDR